MTQDCTLQRTLTGSSASQSDPRRQASPNQLTFDPSGTTWDPRSHGQPAKRHIYIALFSPDGISHLAWHLSSPESGGNTVDHMALYSLIIQSHGNRLSALSSSWSLNWKIWFTTYWFFFYGCILHNGHNLIQKMILKNAKRSVIEMFLLFIWLLKTFNISRRSTRKAINWIALTSKEERNNNSLSYCIVELCNYCKADWLMQVEEYSSQHSPQYTNTYKSQKVRLQDTHCHSTSRFCGSGIYLGCLLNAS